MKHQKRSHVKKTPDRSSLGAKKSSKQSIIINCLLFLIIIFIVVLTIIKLAEFFTSQSGQNSLPSLNIALKDVPIEIIDTGSKDTKYPNNTATFNIDNKSITYENVEIKGRGNSTWLGVKKPYQIKFNYKESLFELEPAKKWILLANSLDASYLRNDIAFYLEKILHEQYPVEGHFADLYIDNQYRGLYFIAEKIEIGKGRVGLKDPSGIIVEIDNAHTTSESCFYSNGWECLVIHESANQDITNQNAKNFIDNFNQLELALDKKDYKKITELIDTDSFARYFILNEFSANHDGYNSSFYLYKDGVDDKIHAGPGWDFDLAFGNKNWIWVPEGFNDDTFFSPFVDTISLNPALNTKKKETNNKNSISPILYNLMEFSEFKQLVKDTYQSCLSSHKEELLNYIEQQAKYIKPSVLKDQERWKLTFDFDDEVDYLVDWVAKRYDHFESVYGASSAAPASAIEESEL